MCPKPKSLGHPFSSLSPGGEDRVRGRKERTFTLSFILSLNVNNFLT
jgi:hypothetical protein